MKMFTFFSLVCVLNVQAVTGQAQQNEVQLRVKNKPLTEVLKMVQQQSGYNILYSNELLKNAKPVAVTIDSKDIREVMRACLKDNALDYEIENGTIIIKAATPQTQTVQKVRGTVVDTKTGTPLPGVTVVAMKNGKSFTGVATDEKGHFEISLPADIQELTFTSVGYKSVVAKIETDREMTVRMLEEVKAIDEVVVTGYFTKAKSSYTGAVKTLSGDELKTISSTNIVTALAALTPGLEIVERSEFGSNPNKVPELLLRGMGSFNNSNVQVNQPTIILDGIEISMQDLYDLDINEIETITVLKDASATALYGSRAANGVIVVERKKLQEGNIRVAYNFTGNVQFPYLKDYHVLNASEKLEYERLAGLYTAKGQTDQYDRPLPAKEQWTLDSLYNNRLMEVNRGVNSDWLAQPARVAFSHDHSLRLYGGASNIRYELNGRFNNVQGVMKDDYRRRYNLGFQLQYHVQNKLTLSNRTSYTEINTRNTPYGRFSEYTLMNPYDRMYDAYGNPNTNLSWDQNNPLYEAKLGNRSTTKEKTFYNNTDIRWDINDMFRINATFNITVNDGSGESFLSPDSQTFKNETDNSKKGSLSLSGQSGSSYSGTLLGSFNKTTESNSLISLNAGFEVRHEHSETSLVKTLGYYDNELDFVGQGSGYPSSEKPSGTQTLSAEIGGFINGTYMYNNRYYADFIYRLTGSSKFGKNNRYAQFWSGGLGWNLHNEKFFQSDKIDLLKLRASAGYTGKVNFESFQAMTIYKYTGDLEYRNGIGATPITIGNDDLKWERELSYNIGTDISLFGRRLNLTFDAYLKRTTDLLLDESKAPSTGITTGKENIGEMKNKGIEFQIDGFLIQRPDLYWQLGMNGYSNKNKIEKISSALKERNAANNATESVKPLGQFEEGESVTALKVVRSAGIDPATGQEVYYTLKGERTFTYNADDKVVIGDTEPKFRGSVFTNVYYKGFSLYLLGTFKCGGYLYNETRAAKIEGADAKYNVDKRAFDERWRNPGDIALYKNIAINADTPKHTDRFVEKENVFTMTTVNLGYEFSQDICTRLHLRNLRLGVNLTDLFRISNVKIERGTDYLYSNGFEFTLSTTF